MSGSGCWALRVIVTHDLSMWPMLSYNMMPGFQGWISKKTEAKQHLYYLFYPRLGSHTIPLASCSICPSSHKPAQAQEIGKYTPALMENGKILLRVYRTGNTVVAIFENHILLQAVIWPNLLPFHVQILVPFPRLSKILSHFSVIFRFKAQDSIIWVRSQGRDGSLGLTLKHNGLNRVLHVKTCKLKRGVIWTYTHNFNCLTSIKVIIMNPPFIKWDN